MTTLLRAPGRALVALVVTLALSLYALPAHADQTADEVAQAQARAKVIEQVRAKLGGNMADGLATQEQLKRSLEENSKQQHQVAGKVSTSEARIAALDREIQALDREIEATNRRVEIEKAQLRALARAIYVQPSSILLMLAESGSLGELMTRVTDLRAAGERAQALKARLLEDYMRLAAAQSKVKADRGDQLGIRDGLQLDLAMLKDLQTKQEASKRELQDKIDKTRSELEATAKQSAELAQKIADLLERQQQEIIAAAMQQVWDQVKLLQDRGVVTTVTVSVGHSKKYRFVWPEPTGVLTQKYGPSDLSFEPAYQGHAHFHTGIDMALPSGAPVLAADDGVVLLVGSGSFGYGNHVVVAHAGGLATLYGHLSKAGVKTGDIVRQGDVLGLEGSTGNSTGPHLHFELRLNGSPIDPSPYLPPGLPSPFRE